MFHDCSVERFGVRGDRLQIETEAFAVGPGEKMLPARIVIEGIGEIYRSGHKVDAFRVESDDAEIYGLDAYGDGVELILIWHVWKPEPASDFVVYRFPQARLHSQSMDGGPLVIVPDP